MQKKADEQDVDEKIGQGIAFVSQETRVQYDLIKVHLSRNCCRGLAALTPYAV